MIGSMMADTGDLKTTHYLNDIAAITYILMIYFIICRLDYINDVNHLELITIFLIDIYRQY